MEDIEKLVNALRYDEFTCMDCEWQAKCNGEPGCLIRRTAADALESLRAENERLRSNCYPRDGVEAIIDERDAAVAFIRHIDSEYGWYINDSGFERWRGATQKDARTHEEGVSK